LRKPDSYNSTNQKELKDDYQNNQKVYESYDQYVNNEYVEIRDINPEMYNNPYLFNQKDFPKNQNQKVYESYDQYVNNEYVRIRGTSDEIYNYNTLDTFVEDISNISLDNTPLNILISFLIVIRYYSILKPNPITDIIVSSIDWLLFKLSSLTLTTVYTLNIILSFFIHAFFLFLLYLLIRIILKYF